MSSLKKMQTKFIRTEVVAGIIYSFSEDEVVEGRKKKSEIFY